MGQILANILKSKTLWFNLLSFAVTVAGTLSGTLPPQFAPYVAAFIAIGNVVLRFLTTTPILPGPTPDPAPSPSPATPLLDWLRDLIDSLIKKEVPVAESKSLALKLVEEYVDLAAKGEVEVKP